MKWLTRLKSEKGLPSELPKLPKAGTQAPEELPKLPKDPFDSFGSTDGRRFLQNRSPMPQPRPYPDQSGVLENMPLGLIEGGEEPFSPDCFSPDGNLEDAFMETQAEGWTDEQLCIYIDALWEAGVLMGPWGFKVMDSPLVGDFWIISDATARDKLPAGAKSFTIEELRPIVEAVCVFEGATVMEVRL